MLATYRFYDPEWTMALGCMSMGVWLSINWDRFTLLQTKHGPMSIWQRENHSVGRGVFLRIMVLAVAKFWWERNRLRLKIDAVHIKTHRIQITLAVGGIRPA